MDLFRNVKIPFESEAEENKQQKSMNMFTQFSSFGHLRFIVKLNINIYFI